jgi:two-component system nitrate/nitrite response regulator NarL
MVKIFLVDDHQIVKYGIKSLLQAEPNYLVVGEAGNAEELLPQIGKLPIDLIISDITLDGMDGVELTKKIKKLSKGVIKVLILSMHADNYHIKQCFEAGANGYLLKDFDKSELFAAIDKVMKNEVYTSKTVSTILATNYINQEFSNKQNPAANTEITKREKEIIELISAGYSNKEIAEKINLSTSTVDVHRYNILKKMNVKNTAEMIMKALKTKIIDVK